MDDKTKTILLTIATGVIKKGLVVVGTSLVGHGIINSNQTETFVSAGMVLAGLAWSFWNDYGRAIVISQLEVLKAKSLAQAAKLQKAGVAQVSVNEIAAQSPTLGPAEVAKTIGSLPASIQATVQKAVTPAVLAALLTGLMFFGSAGSAHAQLKTAAQIQSAIDDSVARAVAKLKSANQVAAMTGTAAQTADGLEKIMSAISKPFQDLADFIATDPTGAATLATQIPGLQDTNGKACWTKMQNAGAVFQAHPVPLTLKVMTDFESLRLLQMTANDLCSYTPCTVVFTDGTTLATAVTSAVGGALTSSAVPSLTSLCARIPQLSPMLPQAVTGVLPAIATAAPAPAAVSSTNTAPSPDTPVAATPVPTPSPSPAK